MAELRGSKCMVYCSPTTQGCSDMGRSKNPKSEKSRRSWSVREEEILLAALKELVAQGWKSDNGFRAGYLNKLEEALRREFPNTDIRVNPNIVSKITSWKKNYYSLQGNHMIECENEQWEQIVKTDFNARLMRNKPWPYWEVWKEIFGKDRANGSNAEDILDAVNDLYAQENIANVGGGDDYHVSFEDVLPNDNVAESVPNDAAEASVCQGQRDNQPPKRSGGKRKSSDVMDSFYDLFKKMHEDTNARLEKLATRIGYEVDVRQARKEVYDQLGRVPGLSLGEKFVVCEVLVKETDRLDLFMSLPEDDRPAYVLHILNDKRKH